MWETRVPSLGWEDLWPGEGNGYPLQHSGLENSMDCIVHGVTKSRPQLCDFHFHLFTVHSLWLTTVEIEQDWDRDYDTKKDVHVCLICFSPVWLFASPWTVARWAPLCMGFSRQEYWSGLEALLQWIFPTCGLLCLLHWQADSSLLAPPGKPVKEVVNATHQVIEKYTGSAEPTAETAFRFRLPDGFLFCFRFAIIQTKYMSVGQHGLCG